jgi:hypothetical protein
MQRLLTTVLGALLATMIPVRSQTITGSISGTVLDPSEAAVANAKITAVEQERKVTTQAVSDTTGRFVFPQMPPGTYTLSIEAAGFKKFDQSNIVLNGNEKLALGNLASRWGVWINRWRYMPTRFCCRPRAENAPKP